MDNSFTVKKIQTDFKEELTLDEIFSLGRSLVEKLEETIKNLESQVISIFSEDEIPSVRQGIPSHELEEVLTAEQVTFFIQKLAESHKGAQWSLIETAPRTGEKILLAVRGTRPGIGRWDDELNLFVFYDSSHLFHPTHWMKLPSTSFL